MAEKTRHGEAAPEDRPLLPELLTPALILVLCAGILALAYVLAPTHKLQKYLGLAFMDDLRTTSVNAGLHIIEQQIETDDGRQTYEKGEVVYPSFGEQYATLVCEDIGLTVGVFYGVNSELLAKGACQTTQSAVLGTGGNTVIDAHVNTFFSELSQMQPGSRVVLYTSYGCFTYEAEKQIQFAKTDKRWLQVTKDDCLTLYTCAPQVIGSSDQRIGMRCKLVSAAYYTQPEDGQEG